MDEHSNSSRTRAETFRDIYINGANIGGTIYDVSIICTRTKPAAPGSLASVVEEQVALQMSPHHLKTFAAMLLEVLFAYEHAHGQLAALDDQKRRTQFLDSIRPAAIEALGIGRRAASPGGPLKPEIQSRAALRNKPN